MKQTQQKINQLITDARKIMIVPHQHPDGDALGAAGALREYIMSQGQTAVIFCATPAHERWAFIPHFHAVETETKNFQDQEIDLIIVLDSGDLRYAGVAKHLANHRAHIVNIDHHATNTLYGHTNLVIPTAAATAEIIYYFFKNNNIAVSPTMATALLTGIITDTDNFTNAATSQTALFAAGALLRNGANLGVIIANTVKNKSLSALKLWGIALARLEKDEDAGITHTHLTQTDFAASGAGEIESEGIANFLNNLAGDKISLILKETASGQIKGSFRTTADHLDVSALAAKLGGGGHKKAAGFTINGTIEEVLKKILQK